MTTLSERVAERIAFISPAVNDKVVDALVDRELDKRADAIVAAHDSLSALHKELAKIKPDVGGYYEDNGNEVKPMHFSKAKFDERKKLLEKIEKHERALDAAIDKGDMKAIYDLKGNEKKD